MEVTLWKGKASYKFGLIKAIGNIIITNKKISFIPFLANRIDIMFDEIEHIEIIGILIKKIKARGKEHVFIIKEVENVVSLIKKMRFQGSVDS